MTRTRLDVSKLKPVIQVTASKDPMAGHNAASQEYTEGICVVCGRQMVATYISGDVPVFACMSDRVVMPLKEQ